jgi:hypothetical protein
MKSRLRQLLIACVVLSLGACVVYEPVPVASQPTAQQRFDQSWSAVAGAMADQGLTIISQDRGAGVMRGARGDMVVRGSVVTRPDGRIQVEIASEGSSSADPGLAQRVHQSYERRMGR